jgi:hypothetical protein
MICETSCIALRLFLLHVNKINDFSLFKIILPFLGSMLMTIYLYSRLAAPPGYCRSRLRQATEGC